MEYSITTLTPPSALPLLITELQAQSELMGSCELATLQEMIRRATDYFETATKRRLIQQTVRFATDLCPGGSIDLPVGPVISITSAEVRTPSGWVTITTPQLVGNKAQRVFWPCTSSTSFPSSDGGPESLRIDMVCGFGADRGAVPPAIHGALLMLAAHFHEQREATIVGTTVNPVPFGVNEVIEMWRIRHYA